VSGAAGRAGRGPSEWLALIAVGVRVLLLAGAYAAWWAGDRLAGVDQALPKNPIEGVLRLARGELVWPVQATILAAAAVVVLFVAAVLLLLARGGKRRSDAVASPMANPAGFSEVTGRSARDKAARLRPGVDLKAPGAVGLRVGVSVRGHHPIYLSWEDVGVVLAGTRMGKTAAVAIPAVCDAPGAVIATSNKPDLHHHTRGVRQGRGRVWVSDLQGIAGKPGQDWWWNPLAGVTSLAPARLLAGHFIDADDTPGSVGNSYFDGGSQELLALHLLAAACVGGDLLHVLEWLENDTSPVPTRVLSECQQPRAAAALRSAPGLNSRQR